MNKTKHVLKMAAMILVAIAGFGAATMLLWNSLLPELFGFPQIGFWQALGLLVLARLLFGGLFGKFHGSHNFAHRRFHKRWMEMTPEERQAFMVNRRTSCHKQDEGNYPGQP